MKLLIIFAFLVSFNFILAKKPKIFCRYNHQGISKVYDPAYFDDQGQIVYAQTIEEYAKILGPTWYGVSWCDNSTMVNSIGLYFDISKIQEKLNKRDNEGNETNNNIDNDSDTTTNNNQFKDNYLSRDRDNIEEYKKNAEKYIEEIYKELKNSEKQCIPLVSVNPAFNPYHKSLIIGIEGSPNIRDVTGSYINFADTVVESVIDYNNFSGDFSRNIAQCAGVNNCKGCTIICNALISTTIENQYSITSSDGSSVTRSIGDITSDSNTLTNDISNTIEVAKSLTKSNSISGSDGESGTSSLEIAIAMAQSKSNTVSDEGSNTHNEEYSESNIHSISEEDSHAVTNTEGKTNELNWNYYKEHSGTKEYSYVSKDDYDYYNNQYEEVKKPDYVKSKYEKRQLGALFKFVINAAVKNGSKVFKTGAKGAKGAKASEAAKEFAKNTYELGTLGASESSIIGGTEEDLKLTEEKLYEKYGRNRVQKIYDLRDMPVNDPTYKPKITYLIEEETDSSDNTGNTVKRAVKSNPKNTNKGDNKSQNNNGNKSGENKSQNNKDDKSDDNKSQNNKSTGNDKVNTGINAADTAISYESLKQEKEIADREHDQTEEWNRWNYWQTENWNRWDYWQTENWNRWNYWQTEDWNNKNYKQTEKWNERNYDQTEKWNNANYQQTEKWNEKNYDQTEYWNNANYQQTESWNLKNYQQTEEWNWKTFNQTEYWNMENEITQFELANFNYDTQEYFTEREERASLIMALTGTHSTSNSDVEGSSDGGAKINSKETSRYNSKTSSEMNQDQITNGYSDAYTIGHTETSSQENSQTDTISNILTNTWSSEHGWGQEESESETKSNGRTFGKSTSNTTSKEVSIEDSKTISKDNTISRVKSNSVTYSVNQQLSNTPTDDGCYEYEVTPKLTSEAVIWACGVNDDYEGDHVEFYTSEVTKNIGNKFIINKTGCSYREKKTEIEINNNDIYKIQKASNGGVANFISSGEELIAPLFDIGGNNYGESVISTNNPKHPWYFGILPSGKLALCENEFDEKHIKWSTETTIPNTDEMNANQLGLKLKIADNGHLVMTAKNILKEYDIKNDDLYKVDISQEIIVWDSLPKDLPFNVGHYGTRGYTLIILENGSSDCQVILYDGLYAPIWKISSKTGASYKGYAFPLEYNFPLKFKTNRTNKYDKHNYIPNTVKAKYSSAILFDCDIIINQEEYMVSDNGVFKAYLQPSGNLVVKEYERTLWSTNTANVGPFSPPYTISLSPIGELVIRDMHKYIVWRTINPYNISEEFIKTNNSNKTKRNDDDELYFDDEPIIFDDDLINYDNDTNNDENNNKTPNDDNNNNKTPIDDNNNNKTPIDDNNNKADIDNKNDNSGKPVNNNSTDKPIENNDNNLYYKLKLTDNGELKIIDNYENIIWSSLFVRKNNYHMRYVEPLVYSITSCNENPRLPYVYNIHSYEQPEHRNIIVDPYFNNLLPGEKLRFEHNNESYLAVTDSELIWNNFVKNETIATCSKIKELKLLDNGLFLYCEDKTETIASLDYNKKYTLTIKKNLRNNEYKLIIMDMTTHKVEWGYPPVKFLNSVESKLHKYMGRIDIANSFTTYDRLLSINGDGNFAYISNLYGLQLIGKGFFNEIYQMMIFENMFVINAKIIVHSDERLKLIYDSEPNSLLLTNYNENIIWRYDGYIYCDVLSSSDENCNSIYSLSPLYNKDNNKWLHLNDNGILFGEFYVELMNLNDYLKTNDVIYSLRVTEDGDILVNKDKYLHKEYYRKEKLYTLEVLEDGLTLALKSSRGEYKWCNNYINNRPLYAGRIYIGDSFEEGEMLYCQNYSLIVLEGNLIYRNHVDGTEKVVYSVPNVRLTSLAVTDRNIVLLSDNKVQYILSDNIAESNTNSFLSCDFSDNSVYWDDGNGKVLWKYSINNSSNSKSNAVLLYNKYYNKCLYAEPYTNEPITYEDCKNKDKYKWYYVNIDGSTYFKSASKENLCIRVSKNRIVLGNCDKNAIIKYIKTSKFIKRDDKCLSGIDDKDDLDSQYYVKLSNCDRHNKKQLWEFISDINDISN